ncbi:hypothetical protein [Streptomyces sp. t39]|uniref:hypothetical protein n=1 Tax=Streptomyces sp. t39 TaxID=1828156 RepID=UPI0011CE20B0|nr:hypothetical protein [Streptomyces sp. t39]TXS51642.1 hypothetical protein EAO77_27810 [Streptomyces sp. t39]
MGDINLAWIWPVFAAVALLCAVELNARRTRDRRNATDGSRPAPAMPSADEQAARDRKALDEAARIARRLPPVPVQKYRPGRHP